ncbi:MAG: hypothetical protein ACYDDF_07550 [Thermoplasmatota archaeon]
MRAIAMALVLLSFVLVVNVGAVQARSCVNGGLFPYGGVSGLTWHYAADTANSVCGGSTDPGHYGDLTCQYLVGLNCDQVLP